jgi:hypothetical protein
MDCPYCGAKNSEEATFCRLCAKRLAPAEFENLLTTPAKQLARQEAEPAGAPRRPAFVLVALALLVMAGVGAWYTLQRTAADPPRAPVFGATSVIKPSPPQMTGPSSGASDAPSADAQSDNGALPDAGKGATPKALANPPGQRPANQRSRKADHRKEVDVHPGPQAQAAAPPEPETPPPPAPTQKAEPVETGFAAELRACDARGFLAGALCKEQVRWTHCTGRWGTVPECPKAPDNNQSGG